MCTVSYVPVRDNIIITSNRDEKSCRSKAFLPRVYKQKGSSLIFPKDGAAGGTWIALKENVDAVVLLNGAFAKHESRPGYSKSRGCILLELFTHENPLNAFRQQNLTNIEPFTIILYQNKLLNECRWDGNQRYTQKLDASSAHIWSSVTLYNENSITKRKKLFSEMQVNTPLPTQQDIMHFHQFSGDGNIEDDLLMRRGDEYLTVSITSILITSDRGSMKYLDLMESKSSEIKFELIAEEIYK